MLRIAALLVSHGAMLAVGFALGVYFLPILTAPKGPEEAALVAAAQQAKYNVTLTRDQKGSDFLCQRHLLRLARMMDDSKRGTHASEMLQATFQPGGNFA